MTDTLEGICNPQLSHFFTNRNGNTLMKEFEGILTNNPQVKNLDAVVGFLRASGYFSLRPFLDGINKVRILIGIDVDKYIAKANQKGELFFGAEEEVKEECLRLLKEDIEQSHYTKQVEDGMLQMVQDLIDGKLELRAHPSKKIHAKLYILYPDNYNQHCFGAAITGSSNLSGNGLGISNEAQYEFNVKLTQFDDVQFAKNEFELLWEEAKNVPINAEDYQSTLDKTYLKGDVTPYELYIKMLMEYFSDRVLAIDQEDPFDMPEGYSKYDYQADAVIEGYQKLIRYDGFFLADVVGLGKTVIATMIAKKFLIENGPEHTKILVVYPPAVEQNWKTTFKDFGIDKYTRFVSNGSLAKVLDEENYDYWNADEYDLVLVDEAHKFRNHTTGAFQQLQEICKMPRVETGYIPGYKKKVMLISATPMNNTPADIYYQILMFQDPRHCTIDGVPNLTAFFSPLVVEFRKFRKQENFDLKEFKKLAEKVRDRVIKPLTVRRTRTDIENIDRYNKDVNGFPKVDKPIKKEYELNDHLANLFERAMHILDKELTYARYQAIAYLKPDAAPGLYDNAEVISRSLAGIRKNGLVKRLESSFYAFCKSLKAFRQANENMIDMWENDKIFIAPDLDINALIEAGYSEEEIEQKMNEKAETNPKNASFKREHFDEDYIVQLKHDQALLDDMWLEWEYIDDDDDSKFAKFEDLLKHELFKKEHNPEGKIVVFSESVDTVEYLQRRINRPDVLVISSQNRSQLFKTIRENFDANWKQKKNDYNIILTTDVLAEGVNLHRSNIIINYDTPWNATRLMQRIGRVNRIGSTAGIIYNYVFYPSRQGNKEIKLNQIALSKIQTFHTTFGEDNQIYSTEEIIDRDLDKLFKESIKREQEDRNQELPFYEELRALYQQNRKEYKRIERLSLRSRTGRESRQVEGVTLSGDSLVFLKTNFRKLFYLVNDQQTRELSVLDALNYFKAQPEEKAVPRIPQHHEHVERALKEFNKTKEQELHEEKSNQSQRSNLGAQVTTAVSLLNGMLPHIEDGDTRLKIVQLKELTERGTITYIAKRLQRIQKDLQRQGGSKAKLTFEDALKQVLEMANKYSTYYRESQQAEEESAATIILSESLKKQLSLMNYKSIIESRYNRQNWQLLLHDIFGNKIKFWNTPSVIPTSSQFAKQALWLGTITLSDNQTISIYEVELSDSVDMERNRRGIRDMLLTDWRNNGNAGAFMFCYRKNESVLRFSYVSEAWTFADDGSYQKESTDAKRFTYLLGEGHRSRTAIQQFEKLRDSSLTLKDLTKAFSVDAVSDMFFKEYKKNYEDIIFYVTGKRMVKVANKWEERQEGEPNEYIMQQFAYTVGGDLQSPSVEKAVRDYVKKLMGRLVFLQFLQKKGWLGVPAGESWGTGDREFIQTLFANCQDKDHFIDNVLEVLFEQLNTDTGERGNVAPSGAEWGAVPYLNGGLFERDATDEAEFPLPAKYMQSLLDFFASYNFTIDENDPDDAEVGVDPEMLGRIFENLLEDNKDKGAFYTPKEIVSYMCRESLIAYLQTDIEDEATKEAIRQFVTTHDKTKLSAATPLPSRGGAGVGSVTSLSAQIDQRLKDVKICDPAIGSGAFPMGLLKELFQCRTALEGIEQSKAAEIKKHIIQQNIYGVDIEKGAVDIARLRFWLSLIVDEETPQALPNLDFKIMQGNSLLEQYKGVDLSTMTELKTEKHGTYQTTMFDDMIDVLRLDLRKKLDEYYNCTDHKRKAILKQDIINNVKQQLKEQSINVNFGDLDLSGNNQFMLWHTWFYDVFSQGGFDIVIGNPPYVFARNSEEKGMSQEDKEIYYKKFALAKYQINLYHLFVEQGVNLLNNKGSFAYIIPNNWMTINTNKDFRKYILSHSNIAVTNFYKQVFENADVDSSILVFSKDQNDEIIRLNEAIQIDKIKLIKEVSKQVILSQKDFIINIELFKGDDNYNIILKMEEHSKPLSFYAQVKCGIKAYQVGKGHPAQSKEEKINRVFHSKTKRGDDYYKYLEGSDVKRYILTWENKEYIRYGNHLAEPRRNWNLFSSVRILVRQIPSKPPYCINAVLTHDTYINDLNSMNIIDMRCDPYYILSILNSRPISFWFAQKFGKLQRGLFPQFKINELASFPIPNVSKETMEKLSKLASKILEQKRKEISSDTASLELEIDSIVSELFGLNSNEIKRINKYE